MTAAELAQSLGGRQVKDHWMCLCPAHDDSEPSLKVSQSGDIVLIHCWAGCRPKDILRALGLEWADLFIPRVMDVKDNEDRTWDRLKRKYDKEESNEVYNHTVYGVDDD